MPYWRMCEFCGARLDPGEHCDCLERKRIYAEQFRVRAVSWCYRSERREKRYAKYNNNSRAF